MTMVDSRATLLQREAVTSRSEHRLAIFVHGFADDHLTCWGALPTLIEAGAENKEKFRDWDYLFIGYDSHAIQRFIDIAERIGQYWFSARNARTPFSDRHYQKLALFGHSLGTLGIRQFLCMPSLHFGLLPNILHSVTLFATPTNGSDWAVLGRLKGSEEISRALRPDSSQIVMLRQWSKELYPRLDWCRVRLIDASWDRIVDGSPMVEWVGDEHPRFTISQPANILDYAKAHVSLVKPERGWDSAVVRHIGDAL